MDLRRIFQKKPKALDAGSGDDADLTVELFDARQGFSHRVEWAAAA